MTRNPDIRFAKSIVDYIFRWLATKFLSNEAQYHAGVNNREERRAEERPAAESGKPKTPVAQAFKPASPKPHATTYAAAAIQNQEDAPPCSMCGSIMVRSGSCYKCANCGSTNSRTMQPVRPRTGSVTRDDFCATNCQSRESARLLQEPRRKPDDPQPIWWMALRASATIGTVTFLVYGGTLVLAHGAPNYFLSAGAAVFCYGEAIRVASGKMFKPSILRMKWLVFALMFSLFAVGAAVAGGPVGIAGAILSVLVANFWWWLVVKIPWSER